MLLSRFWPKSSARRSQCHNGFLRYDRQRRSRIDTPRLMGTNVVLILKAEPSGITLQQFFASIICHLHSDDALPSLKVSTPSVSPMNRWMFGIIFSCRNSLPITVQGVAREQLMLSLVSAGCVHRHLYVMKLLLRLNKMTELHDYMAISKIFALRSRPTAEAYQNHFV